MEKIASLMILAAAVLWGASGIFVNVLSGAGLSSAQITAVRFPTVFIITFLFIFLTDRKKFRIEVRDLVWFALDGIFGVLAFGLCYTLTIQLTGMAAAAVLIYLMPGIVMVFSVVFLREKFTARKGICLLLSFLGCALVSGLAGGIRISGPGLFAGIMTAIFYAMYNLITSIKLNKYASITSVFYTQMFAAPLAVAYAFVFDDLSEAAHIYQSRPQILFVNMLLGFCCSFLTYWIFNTAMHYIPVSRASVISTMEPVAAALFGFFIFREPLTVYSVIGIMCELAALILLQLPGKERKRK